MPVRIDGKRYHPLFKEAARDLLDAGYDRQDAARIIGVSDWTINFWFGPSVKKVFRPDSVRRRVLDMYYQDGKSFGQIAYLLNMPRSTVSSMVFRDRAYASRDARGLR